MRWCLGTKLHLSRIIVWTHVLAAAVLGANVAQAQTSVTGVISATTQWKAAQGPYIVTGDVRIQGGAALTVGPGVVIYMGAGSSLTVDAGSIQAVGTASQPITVTSDKVRLGQAAAAGDWQQWVFGPGTLASRLEYVNLDAGRGLLIQGSSPVLNNIALRNHAGAAITVDLAASPSGVGLQASGCDVNGILVPAGEVLGSVSWGLRGIPYVLASGVLSVGGAPKVSALTPNTVEQGQTVTLSVTGSRLDGLSQASSDIASLALTPFPGGSSTSQSIQLVVPADAPLGSANLQLMVDAGQVQLAKVLTISPPLPYLSKIAPSSVDAFSGPVQLTLNGKNFSDKSEVLVNSAALPSTFQQASASLFATLPQQTDAGSLTVQVRNPSPTQGGQPLLSNALALTVALPTPPLLTIEPSPLALPPDGQPHRVAIRLSKADYKDNQISIAIADTSKATVSPAQVTIPAGQTSAAVNITSVAPGTTSITASSAGLQSKSTPLFVTADFNGINTSYAALVGVVVGSPTPAQPALSGTLNAAVGVNVGAALSSLSPRGLAVGNSQQFTITGTYIPADAQISVQPSAGVSVSNIVVAADGKTATFTLAADGAASLGLRRVFVSTGAGKLFTFADPAQAVLNLMPGLPRVDSVSPMIAEPNSTIQLVVRGANLHGGRISMTPAAGIDIDSMPVISSDGSMITLMVRVDALAAVGNRLVQVATDAGSSSSTLDVGNSFTIVNRIAATYTPVAAPLVGVVLGTPAPVNTQRTLLTQNVGVLLGAGISDVSPKFGVVGTVQTVTITGQGLDAVSSVSLVPAAGMTLGSPSVNAAGTAISFSVTHDAAAALGSRRFVLKGANGVPLASVAAAGLIYTITAPVAELSYLTPNLIKTGSSATVTVFGSNFTNVNGVRFEPATGITVNGPANVSSDGRSLSIGITVDAAAPLGDRVLIVSTAAGDSSGVASPNNTLTLASQISPVFDSLSAPPVGVAVGTPVVNPGAPGSLVAPTVGVQVGKGTAPVPVSTDAVALPVSVSVGAAAANLVETGFSQGSAGVLRVRGVGLQGVSAVSVLPAADLLLGSINAKADGGELYLSLSVAPTAQPGPRRVVLKTASGEVAWFDRSAAQLFIGATPVLSSVSPIVWASGNTYTLTLRGSKLAGVQRVDVQPSDGVQIEPQPQWGSDAAGEFLTLRVYVDPTATAGDRVILLQYPGGSTSSDAAPNNTVNIVR